MVNVIAEAEYAQEEWRVIPGLIFSGFYEASSLGRIKDNISGEITFGVPREYCTYYVKGVREFMVHRLVAFAFLGECPPKIVVNHKDLNKHNNRVSNLEYVTPSRNAKHAYDHYHNKTPEAIAQLIKPMLRLRVAGWTYGDIAKQYSMDRDQVRALIQASGLQTEDDSCEFMSFDRKRFPVFVFSDEFEYETDRIIKTKRRNK